ncbi:MAG: hypothetical protein KBT30_00180, partial [Clostridiales bacterium]|nr:hypothetical protein [Candidatus Apopatousia equi]
MTVVSTKCGAVAILDKASYIIVSDDGNMVAHYSQKNDRIISKEDVNVVKKFLEKNKEVFIPLNVYNGKIYANVNKVIAVIANDTIEFENDEYDGYNNAYILEAEDVSKLVKAIKTFKNKATEEDVNT